MHKIKTYNRFHLINNPAVNRYYILVIYLMRTCIYSTHGIRVNVLLYYIVVLYIRASHQRGDGKSK